MANTLSSWLYRVTNGWLALISVVIFMAFTALVLPAQSAKSEVYSGDVGSPDQSFFYTKYDLYAMADAYGPAGRAAYIRARFTFDVLWPVVYTVFLAATITWVYGKAVTPQSRWRYANLSPILGALFDYLENCAAALVMARYPAQTPVVDMLAPVFTSVKWVFVNGSFVLLLVGFGLWLWRYFRQARQRP